MADERPKPDYVIAHIKSIAVPGDYPDSQRMRSWNELERLARLGAKAEKVKEQLTELYALYAVDKLKSKLEQREHDTGYLEGWDDGEANVGLLVIRELT